MQESIIRTIVIVAAIVTLGLFGFLKFDRWLELENKRLVNAAVDACAQSSRYITQNPTTGIRIEEPIQDRYEACMNDKGLR